MRSSALSAFAMLLPHVVDVRGCAVLENCAHEGAEQAGWTALNWVSGVGRYWLNGSPCLVWYVISTCSDRPTTRRPASGVSGIMLDSVMLSARPANVGSGSPVAGSLNSASTRSPYIPDTAAAGEA